LTFRSRLPVWPDLQPDVHAALAGLPDEGLSVVVWQRPDGTLTSQTVVEADYPELTTILADATAATVLSGYADESRPLATAVLPDDDGVLRAPMDGLTAPSATDGMVPDAHW
jgi:small subunit ribosomal protein S1